jgi:hypothetical protein
MAEKVLVVLFLLLVGAGLVKLWLDILDAERGE